ncbi:MAG: hypothetical protein GX607_17810 [Myxococcales bacterium]|jgi:hypothetical protein|nr:hypothetical protein [Myxococcales bacterium]
MSRFTVHGSERLERTIAAQLGAVRDDLLSALPRRWLDCLVLGGGYGRGEGGAARTRDGREAPHNDYDLLLVHRAGPPAAGGWTRPRALSQALRAVEAKHARLTGLHVDILPVHRARVRRLPPALTWYELGRGHHVLWGDARTLDPLVRRQLSQVHPTEWGRLLMNRAAGLTFARWVLRGEPCALAEGEDPDAFVTRQLQKAWLALGDVWLADRGDYHHLVCTRLRRFEARATEHPAWADAYRDAVAYKLAPGAPLDRRSQRAHLDELTELYVPLLLERAASPRRPTVGLLATVRHVPAARWLSLRPWAYPRERLRRAIAAELSGDRAGFTALVHGPEPFLRLWSRYG